MTGRKMEWKRYFFPRISGDTLKITGTVTMLIDHIAAVIILSALRGNLFSGEQYELWYSVYQIMRGIGRIAFPVFAFLLTEGFFHTGSKKRYLMQLGIFCLISELPYDLAFYGRIYWRKQNIYLTLFLGLLMIWMLEKVKEEIRAVESEQKEDVWWKAAVRALKGISAFLLVIGVFGFVAEKLHSDYGMRGIALIFLFYAGRGNLFSCVLGYLLYWKNPWYILAFLIVYCYDGTRRIRGRGMKYFFYAFYPLHLLILGLIRVAFFG